MLDPSSIQIIIPYISIFWSSYFPAVPNHPCSSGEFPSAQSVLTSSVAVFHCTAHTKLPHISPCNELNWNWANDLQFLSRYIFEIFLVNAQATSFFGSSWAISRNFEKGGLDIYTEREMRAGQATSSTRASWQYWLGYMSVILSNYVLKVWFSRIWFCVVWLLDKTFRRKIIPWIWQQQVLPKPLTTEETTWQHSLRECHLCAVVRTPTLRRYAP